MKVGNIVMNYVFFQGGLCEWGVFDGGICKEKPPKRDPRVR